MSRVPLRNGFVLAASALTLASCTAPANIPPPPRFETPGLPYPCIPPEQRLQLDGQVRQGSIVRGRVSDSRAVSLDGRPVPLAADGNFLIAFDRDAPRTATHRIEPMGGCAAFERTLSVEPGKWDIQSVNASVTGGASSEEFRQRCGPELARIAAARETMRPDSSGGWRQGFIWPVVARISGNFGSQRIYRGVPGSYHSGVDLAAPAGTAYVAPADGVVILAASAPYTLEGNLLIIDHGMGLNSAFLHSQRLLVKEGDVVRRGQPIGIVGATGRATGPHLHWGMKWQDARIDPVELVKGAQ